VDLLDIVAYLETINVGDAVAFNVFVKDIVKAICIEGRSILVRGSSCTPTICSE